MIIFFILFTVFWLIQWTFLSAFIHTNNISRLVYSISNYVMDGFTIGIFTYGYVVFSGLSEQCSEAHPFPYYMMLVILIMQLATFLKYVSWAVLACIWIPIIIYLVYQELRNRRNREEPWDQFEENVFDNLEHKTLNTEIEQQYDSWSIWLVDFEKNDKIIILPWSERHNFHRAWIREWLLRKRVCPLWQQRVQR